MHRKADATIAEIVNALPSLLTRREAAALFRRNPRSLDRWIAQGHLRAVRPAGGFPLIPRAEIERVLREGAKP